MPKIDITNLTAEDAESAERNKCKKFSTPSANSAVPPSEINRLGGVVVDAAIEVHRLLGPGLLESAYEAALAQELFLRRLKVERHKPLPVEYKGVKLDCGSANSFSPCRLRGQCSDEYVCMLRQRRQAGVWAQQRTG
jgi:hypothetical protein